MRIASQCVKNSADLLTQVGADTEVVGIDEGQFFDLNLPAACTTLANSGNNFGGITLDTTAGGANAAGANASVKEFGGNNYVAVNTGTALSGQPPVGRSVANLRLDAHCRRASRLTAP